MPRKSPILSPNEIKDLYNDRKGFNTDFLAGFSVKMPELLAALQTKITPTCYGDTVLKYHHYSLVMNGERKMPFFSAVNIDGISYKKIKPIMPSRKEIGSDKWIFDQRIPKELQIPKQFYKANDFDLGHLVRREDVVWGENLEEALNANRDSFYLTNATPQHAQFNRNSKSWKGLESYLLKNSRKHDLRLSVFSGAIFREDDGIFNGEKISRGFWKVVIMVKENGEPSVTGYIISQSTLVDAVFAANTRGDGFELGEFMTYQVPVSKIEEATGINFNLQGYDPLQNSRALFVPDPKHIQNFKDIKI
jgi:endonuclease G, mitochondrial